jgi:2-polyprenyl-6-methoxyphenol hydroxylase-like FAD-dependent oxidoreductase
MTLRVVVIGGGLGGTAAAVALTRAGIDARVYEQAARLAEVGAGVSLAPNGLRMLERLVVGDAVARRGARHVATLSGSRTRPMVPDQRFHAAVSYSLMSPPRIGRCRILP